MIKLIKRFLLLFRKCQHPSQYRMSAWRCLSPPKGTDVYWCSICRETYTVETKLKFIKKEES